MHRREPRPQTILASVLLVMLVLAGCGGSGSHATTASSVADVTSETQATAASSSQSTPTPASSAAPATAASASGEEGEPHIEMQLTSPAPLQPIPARYTCDGANVSPPLRWEGVPAHTAELDLFVTLLPLGKTVDWAVAGLKPTLRALSAGRLPKGAVVGRNSRGQTAYSLCPAKGEEVRYLVHLFALPHKVPVKPGFNPTALLSRFLHMPLPEGLLGFAYERT
jgi:phosphatidylethanolamine-binding protein (PEBP) family uncharacterized protein